MANPFGTTNQAKPERPHLKVIAELIMTAMAQVQTEMTGPTPKARPIRRLAMMKSWVFRTRAFLIRLAMSKKMSPIPLINESPRNGVRPGVTISDAVGMGEGSYLLDLSV